jgi:hypothetical protein
MAPTFVFVWSESLLPFTLVSLWALIVFVFFYNLWLGVYLFLFQLVIVIASQIGRGWVSNLVDMDKTKKKVDVYSIWKSTLLINLAYKQDKK